ncbi:MAG: hypothetical protein KDK26_02760 [Roseivivax sp.]|nr:hypothetical protein [Roseivivax sp.]
MKHAVTAVLIALGAVSSAAAGIPTMSLPDLTYPTPPQTPTQGCQTPLRLCK